MLDPEQTERLVTLFSSLGWPLKEDDGSESVKVANAWAVLMARLGYSHYVAHVGGFNAATQALKASGAFLTQRLGSTAR